MALPDYDDNPTYLPGLEKLLQNFDVVIVKERLGLYAYQCVKAKWRYRFRLFVWVDNLRAFPGQDLKDMSVIRSEVTNSADGFIVQSQAAQATLLVEGVESDRIIEITPFVESHIKKTKKSRAQARESLKLAEGDFVVAHFGEIEWEEGLQDLVAALKLAMQRSNSLSRRLRMIFCGIGSFSTELRDTFVRMGIDHVATYIQPNRASHEAILLATDAIFVGSIPSRDRSDGDPYRVLRAMVNEVAILGCRTPIIEETCGKHRIDFCIGSAHSLAQALIKLESSPKLAKDVVQKNLETVKARYNRVKCQREFIESIGKLTGLTRVNEQSSIDHLVLEAEARVTARQYIDAIDIIESTFKRNDIPTHHKSNLYRLIGDSFAKLGDNDSAKDAYMQAVELDPYNAKGYIGLGTIGLVKNIGDIAVLHFQKAISLAPEDEMANLGLGLAFHAMNERKEAKRWVSKALSINPQNTVGLYTLVKLSHELNEYTEVQAALEKYVEVHPNDFSMLFTLGGIHFKLARYQEAYDIAARILVADPMDTKAQHLAQQSRRALDETSGVSKSGR